jgi:hypothetical protein
MAGTTRGVARICNSFEYSYERRLALQALGMFIDLLARSQVPGHVAEARVRLWMRKERKRGEREAAGNIVDLLLVARG